MKQMFEPVMVMSGGSATFGHITGLEVDSSGALWVKVGFADATWTWVPEGEAITMGGN